MVFLLNTFQTYTFNKKILQALNKTYIKRNFVAKTWTRSVDFILLFNVFICFVVGFGYFSIVRPFK